MELNEKQRLVVQLIQDGQNVIVNGYAGFGKTTLALAIAQQQPHKTILLLTYNKVLQEATEHRRKELKLNNLTCRTFHAYFSNRIHQFFPQPNDFRPCNNDQRLVEELIRIHDELTTFPCEADLIILDEFQDASFIIVLYLKRLIQAHHQVLILGDERQEIYRTLNDSDSRYFQGFDQFFPEKNWVHTFCNETMRLPPVAVNFVNYCLFYPQFQRLTADYVLEPNDDGRKMVSRWNQPRVATVTYLAHLEPDDVPDTWSRNPEVRATVFARQRAQSQGIRAIESWIEERIEKDGYQLDDVVILVPTRNANYVLDTLQDWLINVKNWPCLPPNLVNRATASERRGKILFSTIHSFKGCERPCVVLFDFSNNHFWRNQTYRKEEVDAIDHLTYVGITRATTHLLVVETFFLQNDPRANQFRARFNWLPDSTQLAKDLDRLGVKYLDPMGDFDPPRNLYPGQPTYIRLNLGPWSFQRLYLPSAILAQLTTVIEQNALIEVVHPGGAVQHQLPARIQSNMAFQTVGKVVVQSQETTRPLTENVEIINTDFLVNEIMHQDDANLYPELFSQILAWISELEGDTFPGLEQFSAKTTCFLNQLPPDLATQQQPTLANRLRLATLSRWVTKRGKFSPFNEIRFQDYTWLDQQNFLGQLVDNAHQNLQVADDAVQALKFWKSIDISPGQGKSPAFLTKCRQLFNLSQLNEAHLECAFDLYQGDFYHFLLEDKPIGLESWLKALFSLFLANEFRERLPGGMVAPKFAWLINIYTGETLKLNYKRQPLTKLFQMFVPRVLYGEGLTTPETMEQFVARISQLLRGEGLTEWFNQYQSHLKS